MAIDLTISLKDTKLVLDLIEIGNAALKDERIPENIRLEYDARVQGVLDAY
jgi:hypothetical protein